MKRFSTANSRLYLQIALPLFLAAAAMGIIVTVAASYSFGSFTTSWASQTAEESAKRVVAYVEDHVLEVERGSRVIASDATVLNAIQARNEASLRANTTAMNVNLQFDVLMILDSDGGVVAVTGSPDLRYGTRPLWGKPTWDTQRPRTLITRLGSQMALVAIRPFSAAPGGYSVAAAKFIDKGLMDGAQIGGDDAFGFYDAQGRNVALGIGDAAHAQEGEPLVPAMTDPAPEIVALISEASRGGSAAGFGTYGSREYRLYARAISLGSALTSESPGYVVGAIDQSAPVRAGHAARNLIALWFVVAVVVLVVLGAVVARRVSEPLVELAEGARRIADGDFTTQVEVASNSEIGDLADSFNQMTDALRERSETLTKKVLELATLYEMSRALGSTLDMEELLGSVLDSALRIFDLDLGYVALRDRDTDALSVRALRGSRGSDADGAVRSSMSEWVVREGRPLIFNPDTGSAYEQIDTITGAKAALCVPLVSSEGTIGSVTVGSSDSAYRFDSDDVRLLSTIANHVTIAIGNIELFTSLQDAYLATVRSLAAAVDAKDSFTRGHSEYVAGYATLIAERMGLSHDQRIALEMAAYLHDIGKIGVAEEILLKPGKLDDDEMVQMRHHPLIGANILRPVAFPWAITPVVRHHHEAWDGTGYPAGLKGEEIPLLARILTVADSYEAITADRPYRAGRSPREALEELERCCDSQFDRRIVLAFTGAILEELEAESSVVERASETVAPDEARAIFSVMVDGVLASFRRLGGPRLALNAEQELDSFLVAQQLPFRVSHGRITFTEGVTDDLAAELRQMDAVLDQIELIVGRYSGSTLVEHFFADALGELSVRMQGLARELGLCRD